MVKRQKKNTKKKRNGKGFKEIFDSTYRKPVRDPKPGHHLMAVGRTFRADLAQRSALKYAQAPAVKHCSRK